MGKGSLCFILIITGAMLLMPGKNLSPTKRLIPNDTELDPVYIRNGQLRQGHMNKDSSIEGVSFEFNETKKSDESLTLKQDLQSARAVEKNQQEETTSSGSEILETFQAIQNKVIQTEIDPNAWKAYYQELQQ